MEILLEKEPEKSKKMNDIYRLCLEDKVYAHDHMELVERAHCKHVRFHDLRHTFATMALENGMDVKTLSAMIGHVSSETTVNI